jgi:hypothetical protein
MVEKSCKYDGTWVEGIKDGHGRLETEYGDVYEGDFKQGAITGKGTIPGIDPF